MKTTPARLVLSRRSEPPKALPQDAAPNNRALWASLFTVLALLSLAGRVAAQGTVPERLSFQGYMEDGTGAPLGPATPVNYPVVFRIFPASSGGTISWSERQVVTFDKGNYSVLLGQGSQNGTEPHPNLSEVVITANGSELYVETTVTVNGNDERILPRLRLLPTPYAHLATRALSAASADQALSVNGSAIAAGSIQQDRLSTLALSNLLTAPISDSRLSANITSGQIADSRLSANITSGQIADSRLSANITSGAIADTRLSANVARRDAANTFTGDQTINGNASVSGNLTVNNNLNLGAAGQFKVTTGEENLRIVRGQVRLTPRAATPTGATRLVGTGFAVRRLTNYRPAGSRDALASAFEITFTTPFAGAPSVTVSPVRDFDSGGLGIFGDNSTGYQELWAYGRVEFTSATTAVVAFQYPGALALDLPFSFIAVGPR